MAKDGKAQKNDKKKNGKKKAGKGSSAALIAHLSVEETAPVKSKTDKSKTDKSKADKSKADKSKDTKAKSKKAKDKKSKAKDQTKKTQVKADKAKTTEAAVEAPPAQAPEPKNSASAEEIEALLRVGEGFDLAGVDPSSTPGFNGKRADAEASLAANAEELGDWQERLYAEAKGGGKRSVLLVVQGMDTSGKGGVMRHVVGAMDPQGVKLTSFKAPTAEEKSKGYLWRIRNALPKPGEVGVFDRSQYEDVLVVRVHNLVPRSSWARRYSGINTFERQTAAKGTAIVKIMLHISSDEQKARLAERIERPDKYWKYNPGDITEREHWDEYMAAYQDALTKCSTDEAPWYVVPADHKWYAHWAIQQILLATMRGLDPQWPPADFDPQVEAERLAAT